MKIVKTNNDLKILNVAETSFKTDAGWQDNIEILERETLEQIINPIENYETNRFIHSGYTATLFQHDIWYHFQFLSGSTHNYNYNSVGITPKENSKMLKQSTESFFSLEFYKTDGDLLPDRTNRKLVFTKIIPLPTGEKYFYNTLNDFIYKPVFQGTVNKNTEILYLYWFNDDTVLESLNLTGNTFWMTAKFYNAKDGSVTDFVNDYYINNSLTNERVGISTTPIMFYERDSSVNDIDEKIHLYYKLTIDRNNFSYYINRYTS